MRRLLPKLNRLGILGHTFFTRTGTLDGYTNRIVKNTIVIHARGKGLESVRQALTKEGYLVVDSSDDETAMKNLSMTPSNMVFVVDDSPQGIQLCSMIRCFSNIPIVALCRNETQNQVEMLNQGADACMSWPVSPLEMIARVRSLQRRYREMYPPEENNDTKDSHE